MNDMALEYNLRSLKPFFKDYAVTQVTRHSVADYTQFRLKQKVRLGRKEGARTVSPATVKRELDMLGAALNLAKREGLIAEVPYYDKPRPSKPRERWLTPEEVHALFLASPNYKLPDFLHVSIKTATRPSSMFELNLFQVDLEKSMLYFNP